MNKEQFLEALELHKKWLVDNSNGKKFEFHDTFNFDLKFDFKIDLSCANLSCANISCANLSCANLSGADLNCADLRWANLRGADLRWANLRGADLRGADLSGADLNCADLRWANLSWANLRGADLNCADLEYSSGLTFSCRSTRFKADLQLAAQLAWHFRMIDFGDCEKAKQAQEFLKDLSSEFHLVKNGEVKNERD